MLNNKKGFTLIELLIVVAIIAILAAIAIPQFSQYRIKGFNGSAQSDAKNWKTTEEACNSTFFSYGKSGTGTLEAPPAGTPGAGILITGAMGGATTKGNGAMVNSKFYTSRNPPPGTVIDAGLGIGVGNNVVLQADDVASIADANIASTAQIRVKHIEGDTAYGVDTESTAIYWCKRTDSIKKDLAASAFTFPGMTDTADDFVTPAGAGTACGGDAPMVNWTAM